MKLTNNVNKISFQGYKNIITGHISMTDSEIKYLCGQLNENGTKDLSELKCLTKMSENFAEVEDDIFSILYMKNPENRVLFLNNKLIPWGTDLYKMEYTLPVGKYKQEEAAALKAYTLMASITRRIVNDSYIQQDKEFLKVFRNVLNIFEKICGAKKEAFEVLSYGIKQNLPPKNVAEQLNHHISQTMHKFFK